MTISQRIKDKVWARQRGGCACCSDPLSRYLNTSSPDKPTDNNVVGLCPNCFNVADSDLEINASMMEYVEYLKNPVGYLASMREVVR